LSARELQPSDHILDLSNLTQRIIQSNPPPTPYLQSCCWNRWVILPIFGEATGAVGFISAFLIPSPYSYVLGGTSGVLELISLYGHYISKRYAAIAGLQHTVTVVENDDIDISKTLRQAISTVTTLRSEKEELEKVISRLKKEKNPC